MAERRRQEIDEKRAKLAELRRAREERQRLLTQAAQADKGSSSEVGTKRRWRLGRRGMQVEMCVK